MLKQLYALCISRNDTDAHHYTVMLISDNSTLTKHKKDFELPTKTLSYYGCMI